MLTRRGFGTFVGGCAVCAALALSSRSSALARAGAAGESIEGSGYRLWFVGGMRETVMMGKREAALDLRTLKHQPHLYGVGPTEGLTGEVTISDSRPSLAHVGADNRIHVSESFDAGAPFFVWAEVPLWKEMPVPDQVRTYEDLDLFVGKAGKDLGLTQAFPFLVAGRVHFIDFHIVNAKPNTPAGMAGHAAIQIPFSVSDQKTVLIGFWSDKHNGVFTPMDSNVHVHFQNEDNSKSGHVQGLDLRPQGMTLYLPKHT